MGAKKKAPEKVEAKIELVRIKDIVKNRLRDLTLYSYQEEKIAGLIESYQETFFWDGQVIGRRIEGGEIEIAFGHRRVKAAERVYGPEGKIPITVKPLTDDQMRKIMVRENKAEWGCLPAAIDDAVKASRNHLRGDREHAKKTLSRVRPRVKRVRIGAPAIAKDTGYPVSTVELSLQRLEWIEKKQVDPKALYKMPHQEAAKRFGRIVSERHLTIDQQKVAAENIAKQDRWGEDSIEQMITRVKPLPAGHKSDPRYAGFFEIQLRRATGQIRSAVRMLRKLDRLNERSFLGLVATTTDEDISEEAKDAFDKAMAELVKQYEIVGEALERNPEHGKAL